MTMRLCRFRSEYKNRLYRLFCGPLLITSSPVNGAKVEHSQQSFKPCEIDRALCLAEGLATRLCQVDE
jgi:hypothetical protein